MNTLVLLAYLFYTLLTLFISYMQIEHLKNNRVKYLGRKAFLKEAKKLISIEKYRIYGTLFRSVFLIFASMNANYIIDNSMTLDSFIFTIIGIACMISLMTSILMQKQSKNENIVNLFMFDIQIILYILLYPLIWIHHQSANTSLKLERYQNPINDIFLNGKLKNIYNKTVKLYMTNKESDSAYVIQHKKVLEIFIGKTLFEVLDKDEILAIIYHEVGHHAQNRFKVPFFIILYCLVVFYIFSSLVNNNAEMVTLILLLDMALFLLFVLYNFLKRKEEVLADRFSVKMLGNNTILENALRKGYEKYHRFPSSYFLFAQIYSRYPNLQSRINLFALK